MTVGGRVLPNATPAAVAALHELLAGLTRLPRFPGGQGPAAAFRS